MKIEITDLRLFVNIAECQNLTRGAEMTFMSPPSASARIKMLEVEIGRQLFNRRNKGVTLTTAGELFLKHARLVLRQFEVLKDEMINKEAGRIRVFANTTAVTEFLPELLAKFLSDRPRVTVDLQERLTNDIIRSVAEGTADLGIVSGDIEDAELEAIRFSTDRLVLAISKNHALSRRKHIQLSETLEYEHIGLHDGSTLLDFLRRQFRRGGYGQSLRIQVRSFEAMCRIIEAGVGIGVVPESAALRHAQTMDIKLLRLDDEWALRDRFVLIRERSALPSAANALIELLVLEGAGGAVDN